MNNYEITNIPKMYFHFDYENTPRGQEAFYYGLEDVIKTWYENCIKGTDEEQRAGKVFTIESLKEDYQLTIINENETAYYIDYALTEKDDKDVLYITYWEASY